MVPYRPYLWGVLRTVHRSGSTGSTGTILPVLCTTVREGTTYYGTVATVHTAVMYVVRSMRWSATSVRSSTNTTRTGLRPLLS